MPRCRFKNNRPTPLTYTNSLGIEYTTIMGATVRHPYSIESYQDSLDEMTINIHLLTFTKIQRCKFTTFFHNGKIIFKTRDIIYSKYTYYRKKIKT